MKYRWCLYRSFNFWFNRFVVYTLSSLFSSAIFKWISWIVYISQSDVSSNQIHTLSKPLTICTSSGSPLLLSVPSLKRNLVIQFVQYFASILPQDSTCLFPIRHFSHYHVQSNFHVIVVLLLNASMLVVESQYFCYKEISESSSQIWLLKMISVFLSKFVSKTSPFCQ